MVGKNLPTNAGDVRDKGSSLGWENLLEGAWKPTPVFLPGKFHEQRTLAGYSPLGRKESDRTEVTEHSIAHSTHF